MSDILLVTFTGYFDMYIDFDMFLFQNYMITPTWNTELALLRLPFTLMKTCKCWNIARVKQKSRKVRDRLHISFLILGKFKWIN